MVNACRLIQGAYTGAYTGSWPGRRNLQRRQLRAGGRHGNQIIQQMIYCQGFNTNYTASWFMVRSGVTVDTSGNVTLNTGLHGCSPLSTQRAALHARADESGPQ